jgi:3-hydroxyacyl-CoA dehydrogenase/3a,7a,12a-trihydroxy-5b-cholest-24-enoyl-CoA hydratase/multifunctional beta-oxidation protein/peroxisomal enoyl-CoA hydratase 2
MTEAFDIKKALAYTTKPYEVTLTKMDTILYALGIGFSKDPLNKEHLQYTYENSDNFKAFPTNSLVVCHRGPFAEGEFDIPGIPPFNPMNLLHGEEILTIETPVRSDCKYAIQEKVVDV